MVGAPKGGEHKISRFFSRSHHNFLSFFPLLGGLLVEFWWCLKRRGPRMCTFGVLRLSCETRAALGGPAEGGPAEAWVGDGFWPNFVQTWFWPNFVWPNLVLAQFRSNWFWPNLVLTSWPWPTASANAANLSEPGSILDSIRRPICATGELNIVNHVPRQVIV